MLIILQSQQSQITNGSSFAVEGIRSCLYAHIPYRPEKMKETCDVQEYLCNSKYLQINVYDKDV